MRILVTGGSGFIGTYVMERLKELGHQPVLFDRKKPEYPPDCEVQLGDTRDFTSVMESIGSTEGFIHLAGVLGTQETIDEPEPAVETNIVGGLNVFRAAKRYKRPGVYIAVGNHWMNNTYSITKTTAERFAFMFNQEHGTKIRVVRALNAYGPKQKHAPVRKIMPNFAIPALMGKPITVYGDGTQVMDMIFVEDVAAILVEALFNETAPYDVVYEAGTGRATTVNDIVHTVLDSARPELTDEASFDKYIEHVPMRPGEPERSVVLGDPTTLKPLDFSAEDLVTLEDGVARTVEWYRENIVGVRA